MQNISGGRGKIYRINDFLANTTFDVIAIQETWFDHSVNSDEITASVNYGIFRMDRSKFKNDRTKGGGICIFVRNELSTIEIINPEHTMTEMQAIRVTSEKSPLVIINVY